MYKNNRSITGFPPLLVIFLMLSFWSSLTVAAQSSYSTSLNSETDTAHAIAADLLIGSDDITGVRLSYRPFVYAVSNVPFFDKLDIYWELSANFWEYGEHNHHTTNFVLALSPVFSKTFYHIKDIYPLKWEFGIGVSLVNDTQFAGKDIGSHYQFEDRLGLTVDVGNKLNQSISLRYMHYSNGGLNSHNPGVDFLSMSYVYRF